MMNHSGGGGGGGNSTTINDLDDNMLTQILFRLPSGESVLACIPVNKRWCSIISHPKFATNFRNHKKESTTLSETRPNINNGEPLWTFISDMIDIKLQLRAPRCQYSVSNGSTNGALFQPLICSMRFLPCAYVIDATFKDLVLCSGPQTIRGDSVFNIANPITKQLVALPSCRGMLNQRVSKPWVGLVCQQSDDYTQDYKFRVVMINQCGAPVYDLLVYCSEICEWKKFKLTVSINPELGANRQGYSDDKFQGVVCNGIIYLHHMLYFAAFNPFDVDETTANATTIEAKVLPLLPDPVEGYLRECSGKLFILHNPHGKHFVRYNKLGRAIELPLKVWKLDPNQVPLIWKTTFEGLCTSNVDKVEDINSNRNSNIVWNIGMHPNNDKLIYMYLLQEQQLVLCDTRTRLIKPLKGLPGHSPMGFDRLELQWWPTPVPKAYVKKTRLRVP